MEKIEKSVSTTIITFRSNDGKLFENETECLNHESYMRGKSIVKQYTFEDTTRYYFFVSDEETWEDCINYLGQILHTNFKYSNKFEDFRSKWVFTELDYTEEFYHLVTKEYLIERWQETIESINNDIEVISNLM